MKTYFISMVFGILFSASLPYAAKSQNLITGTVADQSSGLTIIGAKVVIQGQPAYTGTITDIYGRFSLETDIDPPFVLEISSIGFSSAAFNIYDAKANINVTLLPETSSTRSLGAKARPSISEVSAVSKLTELKAQSPVSVGNLGVLDIQHTANQDFFHTIDALKEAQLNISSLSFSSVNTRGFADVQNWRFIQYIDGMDMNAPGLNYSLGNFLGGSVIDLRNIELVPGPGSALYGPNAYNGILSMHTKNPFEYPGVALYVSSGTNQQEGVGNHPFANYGIRLAKSFNNTWGIKLNFSFQNAQDWEANDESYHITTVKVPFKDQLLQLPPGSPNFDAVNIYGDEVAVPVNLGDTTLPINRTGFRERDIVDYDIDNFRINGSIHYRPKENWDLSYHARYVQGDAILRHTTIYPFVNVSLLLQKLELQGPDFFIRGYLSQENAQDSYQMLATGAFIQQGLKSDSLWGDDYGKAFRGEIIGVDSASHNSARFYADRNIPGSESTPFQELRKLTLSNPDVISGGSKFIDKSQFFHLEGKYDFDLEKQDIQLQAGGSMRRYRLNSEGKLFNDGPNGFNTQIPINEFGIYLQGIKRLADERISLQASWRFDKNQNFEGRITPRLSTVFSLDPEKRQNLRLSFQSGFRNPASQETYIALDVGSAIILGGTDDNIQNYRYQLADGTQIQGQDLFANLVTLPSVLAFQGSGGTNPSLLEPANLSLLQQEKLSTFEIGYKADLRNRLEVDVNFYYNMYRNFVTRVNAYSLQVQRVFAVYTNIEETITSYGASAGIKYKLPGDLSLWANYAYAQFDAEEAIKQNPGFLPAFNTPSNRFKIGLYDYNVFKGVGFNTNLRWSEEYLWQSPFGEGLIPTYTVLDAAIFYKIQPINTLIKVGANNLLGNPYRTVYGGPAVGSTYYINLTFDKYVQ